MREPMDKIGETMAKSASYTAPIFGWRCCDLMAQAAAVLGCEADAAFYKGKAAAMKRAIAGEDASRTSGSLCADAGL